MGPPTRCIGDLIPDEPEPFQNSLPASPAVLPDYLPVRASIEKLLVEDPNNADAFINLAYQCAATYRVSDHHGGCNGARIRFEHDWPENAGTKEALDKLAAVKDEHNDVSFSDLIVLAGITALESENDDLGLPFCGGGVDADSARTARTSVPASTGMHWLPSWTISWSRV